MGVRRDGRLPARPRSRTGDLLTFVCPRCTGALETRTDAYGCDACALTFPIVCGIPDFRLAPDPYIGIDDDRRKAERLFERGASLTFAELLRHYYDVTPDDPPDLAARWIPRAVAEPDIARALLDEYGFLSTPAPGTRAPGTSAPLAPRAPRAPHAPLLDVGCSTGGLLVAAHGAFDELVGVDVAMRWLAVGRVRLREAGVAATLVCANAEHLPFPAGAFDAVTCTDTLEHVRDAAAALAEACRVSRPGARLLATANNRLAPLPEPNIHLWGVAQLPRRWQAGYVKRRRGDLHPYRIALRSARELRSLAAAAGYADVRVGPGAVLAPHVTRGWPSRALAVYDRARGRPVIGWLLAKVGPKLVLTAAATVSTPPSP
jgi:demethylmenaquinone methyltransferase/2-methoxy-6-polyprenyl-1,4-benzoquinol methylase